MSDPSALPDAVPSATILLLRDSPEGVQVFMVVRHHQIDFASGALVFPGGKLDGGDWDPAFRERCQGERGLDDDGLALRVGAIREAFEECGVLLARRRGEAGLVDPAGIADFTAARDEIQTGKRSFAGFLAEHDLMLALDVLVPYAHWITPDMMPRRYDTHFYLAMSPASHEARHDGSESVDSIWINPARALAEAIEGTWTIIFPTRMNLLKLARSQSVMEALERAMAERIVTVKPWIEDREGTKVLCIPSDAGYGAVVEPLENLP